jgi:hypothetical protein
VAFLSDHALQSWNPFVRLAVAGPLGLLVYLVSAIPRADLRAWITALRPRRAQLEPAPE